MKYIPFFLCFLIIISCNEDDDFEFNCCGENPFAETNVDNLEVSLGGKVMRRNIPLTPNNDGINDRFFFINIESHPNNTFVIFDSNDNIVFETEGYNSNTNAFPSLEDLQTGNVPEQGVYRYRLVIENEDVFLEEGLFCLILEDDETVDTSGCDLSNGDPLITGN